MILTVTALPSAAETHGSQSPNVTTPLFSTAPSAPSGSRSMASQRFPLDVAEQDSAGVRLQADEARLLRGRGKAASRRLRIAGEMELVYHLPVERNRDVGTVDGDVI